jgi:hypothetical protein
VLPSNQAARLTCCVIAAIYMESQANDMSYYVPCSGSARLRRMRPARMRTNPWMRTPSMPHSTLSWRRRVQTAAQHRCWTCRSTRRRQRRRRSWMSAMRRLLRRQRGCGFAICLQAWWAGLCKPQAQKRRRLPHDINTEQLHMLYTGVAVGMCIVIPLCFLTADIFTSSCSTAGSNRSARWL